jgi:hypothetical protein
MLYIDGKPVKATHVAYDGCHKFYMIFTVSDFADMLGNGYEQSDIHPLKDLPQLWEDSCGLKFISPASLEGPDLVPQFRDEEPVIEWKED